MSELWMDTGAARDNKKCQLLMIGYLCAVKTQKHKLCRCRRCRSFLTVNVASATPFEMQREVSLATLQLSTKRKNKLSGIICFCSMTTPNSPSRRPSASKPHNWMLQWSRKRLGSKIVAATCNAHNLPRARRVCHSLLICCKCHCKWSSS